MNDTPTPRVDAAGHYARLITHVEANSARHPWYGPCDGLGHNSSCSECDNIAAMVPDLERQLAERDEQLAYVKGLLNTSEGSRRILGDLLSDEKDRLAEATAWRPIETAPKDGERILLYGTPARRVIGSWDDAEGVWIHPLFFPWTPTHWQPLPNPPTV